MSVPFGAIEKAVDVAMENGLEAAVDALDSIGVDLLSRTDFWGGGAGLGEGLSDDVDIDKERRVGPKVWDGEGRGDEANDVRFCTLSDRTSETGFLIVVTAKGEMASNIACVLSGSPVGVIGFGRAFLILANGPAPGVLEAVGLS